MKSTFTFYSVCLGLAFFFCFSAEGQRLVGKHSPDQAYEYNVFLPEGFEENPNRYPVIVYLHGGNAVKEVTDINDFSQFRYGIPKLIKNGEWPMNDFVIVVPHLPCNTFNDKGVCFQENNRLWEVDSLDRTILDFKGSEFANKIDNNRIYFTGISLGAKGVWDYSVAYPEVPAAIVPISGNAMTDDICNLKDTPVWAFHGDADDSVFPDVENEQGRSGTYTLVKLINSCPENSFQARLSPLFFKGHEHDGSAWDPIYDLTSGYDTYEWMLRHEKTNTENIRPFVQITQGDQKYAWRNESIILKLVSDAFDSEGDPLTYSWSLIQGIEENVEFLSLTDEEDIFLKFKGPGDYIIQLAVDDGKEALDEVEITILESISEIQVLGLELYNGDDNTLIRELKTGDKIDTDIIGTENINIRAVLSQEVVPTVRFSINDNRNFRTVNDGNREEYPEPEKQDGYFLFDQKGNTSQEWKPTDVEFGEFIITATPYLSKNPASNPGISSNFVIYVNEEPDPIILPVEFLDVSAQRQMGKKITVSWATASEEGNDFFTIERSSHAGNAFEAIGTVDGAGDSKIVRRYNFTDHNPLGSKAYYRIKQTDFDGKSDYSRIVSVAGSNQFEVSLFPNPSDRGQVYLRLSSADFYSEVNVQLFDAIGNQYFSDSFSPELLFNEEGYLLSKAKSLKAGIYFIIISQGENKVQRKLVVN